MPIAVAEEIAPGHLATPTNAVAPDPAARQRLNAAVAAVSEHSRIAEQRRMAFAHAQRMTQAHDAALLQRLNDCGALVTFAFDAAAPWALRETPVVWAPSLGLSSPSDDHLLSLFADTDRPRLQRVLQDETQACVASIVRLRAGDSRSVRCCLQLLPVDPAQADVRWACLVRLPHDAAATVRAAVSAIGKPLLRPRTGVWPVPSL